MMRSKTRWTLAGSMALVVMGVAWATPASGVVTMILTGPVTLDEFDLKSNSDAHKVMIKTWGASDLYVVHNKVAPGGHTGWHSHPGISFVTVKAGTATEFHGDDPTTPHVYPKGTGFVEEAGAAHIIRNEGTVELELVAFQIIPFGEERRIDEPAP